MDASRLHRDPSRIARNSVGMDGANKIWRRGVLPEGRPYQATRPLQKARRCLERPAIGSSQATRCGSHGPAEGLDRSAQELLGDDDACGEKEIEVHDAGRALGAPSQL